MWGDIIHMILGFGLVVTECAQISRNMQIRKPKGSFLRGSHFRGLLGIYLLLGKRGT